MKDPANKVPDKKASVWAARHFRHLIMSYTPVIVQLTFFFFDIQKN